MQRSQIDPIHTLEKASYALYTAEIQVRANHVGGFDG